MEPVGRVCVRRLKMDSDIENGVLHHHQRAADPDASATMTLSRVTWDQIVTGKASLPGLLLSGDIDLDGSRQLFVLSQQLLLHPGQHEKH